MEIADIASVDTALRKHFDDSFSCEFRLSKWSIGDFADFSFQKKSMVDRPLLLEAEGVTHSLGCQPYLS